MTLHFITIPLTEHLNFNTINELEYYMRWGDIHGLISGEVLSGCLQGKDSEFPKKPVLQIQQSNFDDVHVVALPGSARLLAHCIDGDT